MVGAAAEAEAKAANDRAWTSGEQQAAAERRAAAECERADRAEGRAAHERQDFLDAESRTRQELDAVRQRLDQAELARREAEEARAEAARTAEALSQAEAARPGPGPPTARLGCVERRMSTTLPPIPARIGPAEISRMGSWIAIRCPRDLAPLVRQAGGVWEPGSRRWLVERRRLGPLLRALRRDTDPLFRQAGLDLDER